MTPSDHPSSISVGPRPAFPTRTALLLLAALAPIVAGCERQQGDWTRAWGLTPASEWFGSYIYTGPPELRLTFVCHGEGPWPVLAHDPLTSVRPAEFSYTLDGGRTMGPYSTFLLPGGEMSVPFDTELKAAGEFVVGLASAETADLTFADAGHSSPITATVGVAGLNAAVVEMDCQ